MLHKERSIAACYRMDLESELLAIFSGHEVLMAKGQRKLITGLEIPKSVGVGVGGSSRFGVKIVFEYVGDLANGIMSVSIRVGWIEVDPDLVAG